MTSLTVVTPNNNTLYPFSNKANPIKIYRRIHYKHQTIEPVLCNPPFHNGRRMRFHTHPTGLASIA